jgi:hypothetical protein
MSSFRFYVFLIHFRLLFWSSMKGCDPNWSSSTFLVHFLRWSSHESDWKSISN